MNIDLLVQGNLFTSGFLTDTIQYLAEWKDFSDAEIEQIETKLCVLVKKCSESPNPNEAYTEQKLINPVLSVLGWTETLPQQNLSPKGREDIPDGLLFATPKDLQKAMKHNDEWQRYTHATALLEAKRWSCPLDRRSDAPGEDAPPSTQMLRYMRRADIVTQGKLRWGILTNGRHWRLYFSGARSVSEEFFEIDLWTVLGLEDAEQSLGLDAKHWLKVFVLAFRREAFLAPDLESRSFHARAIDEGRNYEARIAEDLSDKVFNEVFPNLASAIADAAQKGAKPGDVREGALVALYRLLFLLYAEDRNLLPVSDERYERYSLRRLRRKIGDDIDAGMSFSGTMTTLWANLEGLFRCIGKGDADLGLPPYNGGLFDQEHPVILDGLRLPDSAIAPLIDALSFERTTAERKFINYRDLSVQQLGSVYERILEHDVVRQADRIAIQLNPYARKVSGSYYTPDELVQCVLGETVEPLLERCRNAFEDRLTAPEKHATQEDISALDPASRMLDLQLCDPAMGSGHFLVALVDYLADRVIAAMAEATHDAKQVIEGYISPLVERIAAIRSTIISNAQANGWVVDESRLDDRHIVRRMVLKRCVFGVDKNPMAVELAKVSLWLHTFTVGAPLSFLDHHLRCGDSLFGAWAPDETNLFLRDSLHTAIESAKRMERIELLTDAEIAEVRRSATLFSEVRQMTDPLNAFLSLNYAFEWLNLDNTQKPALLAFHDGLYGDPVGIAQGEDPESPASNGKGRVQKDFEIFRSVLADARSLIAEEGFINWQVNFPGVWPDRDKSDHSGGFDAVIGNPPWGRMKLQEVEWFAVRASEIAKTAKAAERKALIGKLGANDPLKDAYRKAAKRAKNALDMVRNSGDYPLLGSGDINLYSLFVERAMTLIREDGLIGLVVPSGIAADKTASKFFRGVSTTGRLKRLYDFENGRSQSEDGPFFKDVNRRFKFSILVAGRRERQFPVARCAFFVQDMSELEDPERCFELKAEDFFRVNPNTGTAPIFRTRRDAALATAVYKRLPVLVNRSGKHPKKTWPVRYRTMFHMTNDSGLFRTRTELEEREGAWPVGGNIYNSAKGRWLPLYEGKMVQAYDHRAASVVVNPGNLFRPGQPLSATPEQHADPGWAPDPQYWAPEEECASKKFTWRLCYKMITAPTNARTLIAGVIPRSGIANSMGMMLPEDGADKAYLSSVPLMIGNLNAIPFDFVLRQKIQGQNINWYMMEQLPVVPLKQFEKTGFGSKSAAEVIREAVLELTYTSHDMAPFAQDMGHVDEAGKPLPPFRWDEVRRLELLAKLDAVFFHLYGITDRDDVRHICGTFKKVESEEIKTYGRYRSQEMCLAWINALTAGNPDAEIRV